MNHRDAKRGKIKNRFFVTQKAGFRYRSSGVKRESLLFSKTCLSMVVDDLDLINKAAFKPYIVQTMGTYI